MNITFRLASIVVFNFILTLTSSQGEIVYDMFYRTSQGDAFDSVILLNAGATVTADIIFRETVDGGTATNIGVNQLGGVGFHLLTNGSDGTFTIVSRPNFDIPNNNSVNGNDADTISGASPFTGGVAPVTNPSPGVYEANIATVQLTAPSIGNASTVFSFVDSQPDGIQNFGGNGVGNGIDDQLIQFQSLTLTVIAVPEPSLTAFVGFGIMGVGFSKCRRKFAKTQKSKQS